MEQLSRLSPENRLQLAAEATAKALEIKQQMRLLLDLPTPYTFYGANAAMLDLRTREAVLAGPSETGKTLAALTRLHRIAVQYPGAQLAILRKTYQSMPGSVLKTFEEKVLGRALNIVHKFGGEKPEFYDYPNRTRIWVGGLDNPNRALSSERDAVYVNQAEELSDGDWETLLTRTTGRAGHMPYAMLFGDANPGAPNHWILSRERAGHLLRLNSRHEDNPSLYDPASGRLTAQGIETMRRLDSLTGYRKQRLRYGLWVQAEGIIYDQWRDPGSVQDTADFEPGAGELFWAVDDGYSAGSRADQRGLDDSGEYVADAHPRVILWIQERRDGQLVVFAESYKCLTLSNVHIDEQLQAGYANGWLAAGDVPSAAVHGPGTAEIRGRLHAAGIAAKQAKCSVEEGIKELNGGLAADANGWRRVLVNPRCRHLRHEMVSCAYDDNGKPAKQFDHGPDALRYIAWSRRYQTR